MLVNGGFLKEEVELRSRSLSSLIDLLVEIIPEGPDEEFNVFSYLTILGRAQEEANALRKIIGVYES
jgi:hypothetical protein